ncbi:unnamed protein product [Trichogramma brassicae]|uniref:Secreted protein n=1 Tax=Trichogramma brassicae TaxID=86971 RepID=A0A6H5IHQ1_9HYME|nr:unnamed protein product [Trichogramma brassicae]
MLCHSDESRRWLVVVVVVLLRAPPPDSSQPCSLLTAAALRHTRRHRGWPARETGALYCLHTSDPAPVVLARAIRYSRARVFDTYIVIEEKLCAVPQRTRACCKLARKKLAVDGVLQTRK